MYYYYKLSYYNYDYELNEVKGIVYSESYNQAIEEISDYYVKDESDIENIYLENLGDLGSVMELPSEITTPLIKYVEGRV